jgi:hypothetical protein
MRVLLEECVPRGLRKHLPGHDISTVSECGRAGEKNGALMRLAAERFDVILTVDKAPARTIPEWRVDRPRSDPCQQQ